MKNAKIFLIFCLFVAIASKASANGLFGFNNDSSVSSQFLKAPYFSRDYKSVISKLNPLEKFWNKRENYNESENLEEVSENKTIREHQKGGCECENYRCRCCAHFGFKHLRINETGLDFF